MVPLTIAMVNLPAMAGGQSPSSALLRQTVDDDVSSQAPTHGIDLPSRQPVTSETYHDFCRQIGTNGQDNGLIMA